MTRTMSVNLPMSDDYSSASLHTFSAFFSHYTNDFGMWVYTNGDGACPNSLIPLNDTLYGTASEGGMYGYATPRSRSNYGFGTIFGAEWSGIGTGPAASPKWFSASCLCCRRRSQASDRTGDGSFNKQARYDEQLGRYGPGPNKVSAAS